MSAQPVDPEYEKRIGRLISRWEGRKDTSTKHKDEKCRRDDVRQTTQNPESYNPNDKGKEFVKETLNTPVVDECDVLIIGGGPAGTRPETHFPNMLS